MISKPTQHTYFWIILFAFLTACGNQAIPVVPETPLPTGSSTPRIPPTATPTPTFIPFTPSPTPAEPVIPVITPDPIQIERWNEYENALATVIHPYLPPEKTVCEWDILGRVDQEVYVWAYCADIYSAGPSAASVPAVIHLEADGSVESAEIPGSGTAYGPDIERLFPPDLQQRIFDHVIALKGMGDRMRWRRGHPEEPPLIILNSLSTQPTPVVIPWMTPDPTQGDRWREYQTAIAEGFFFPAPDKVLCEWEFLGRVGNEVYVWAICANIGSQRVDLEDLFRIDVNDDGSVQNAFIRGPNVYPMLPPEAREKYFSGSIHFQELVDRLRWRVVHPEEPPLIVLNTTPTP